MHHHGVLFKNKLFHDYIITILKSKTNPIMQFRKFFNNMNTINLLYKLKILFDRK